MGLDKRVKARDFAASSVSDRVAFAYSSSRSRTAHVPSGENAGRSRRCASRANNERYRIRRGRLTQIEDGKAVPGGRMATAHRLHRTTPEIPKGVSASESQRNQKTELLTSFACSVDCFDQVRSLRKLNSLPLSKKYSIYCSANVLGSSPKLRLTSVAQLVT